MVNHNCFPILLGEGGGVRRCARSTFDSVFLLSSVKMDCWGSYGRQLKKQLSQNLLPVCPSPVWNSFFCCSLQMTHKDRQQGGNIQQAKKVCVWRPQNCVHDSSADRHKTSWHSAVFLSTNGYQSGVSAPTITDSVFFDPYYFILWNEKQTI